LFNLFNYLFQLDTKVVSVSILRSECKTRPAIQKERQRRLCFSRALSWRHENLFRIGKMEMKFYTFLTSIWMGVSNIPVRLEHRVSVSRCSVSECQSTIYWH